MNALSSYFTWEEVIHSETAVRLGLDNTPPTAIYPSIKYTALQLDKVRKILNRPIIVSSWYRSERLCLAIGSKATSQHTKGEAVDFICPKFGSSLEVAKALVNSMSVIPFDQLIYEGTWVHISFSANPRGEILTFDAKTKTYSKGLPNGG